MLYCTFRRPFIASFSEHLGSSYQADVPVRGHPGARLGRTLSTSQQGTLEITHVISRSRDEAELARFAQATHIRSIDLGTKGLDLRMKNETIPKLSGM